MFSVNQEVSFSYDGYVRVVRVDVVKSSHIVGELLEGDKSYESNKTQYRSFTIDKIGEILVPMIY